MLNKLILIVFFHAFLTLDTYAQGLKIKLTEHNSNVETVVYSSNGQFLATGDLSGLINLYTIDSFGNPNFKQSFSGHLDAVLSLWFSKNNNYIVSCGKDFSARIWNIDTPDLNKTFNNNVEAVKNAFLDPSGKYIITCCTDGTIKSTNINDIKKTKIISVGKPLNDVLLSNDKKFYYATKGSIVLKIDAMTGKTVTEFIGHKDAINALDISPDGITLVSASSDKTIKTWDLTLEKEIKTFFGYEWKVTSVEFSADGKYILGGCNTGETKLFETETGKEVGSFKALGKNVKDVAFSANSEQIAIATSMDVEKYGALIYNSGVEIIAPIVPSKKTGTTTPKSTKPLQKK
ncbi:MAG: WD40 repeat domain-containing protein [Bacteroidetes bacterium]|nr:WD40 repeat domain-containing protein [Bacteroidota bacterium]